MEHYNTSKETLMSNAALVAKIIELINSQPNDQELGKVVRLLVNSKTDQLNNEYIDNSHEKGY